MSYIKLSEQLVEKHRQENIEMAPMIEKIMMLGLALVPSDVPLDEAFIKISTDLRTNFPNVLPDHYGSSFLEESSSAALDKAGAIYKGKIKKILELVDWMGKRKILPAKEYRNFKDQLEKYRDTVYRDIRMSDRPTQVSADIEKEITDIITNIMRKYSSGTNRNHFRLEQMEKSLKDSIDYAKDMDTYTLYNKSTNPEIKKMVVDLANDWDKMVYKKQSGESSYEFLSGFEGLLDSTGNDLKRLDYYIRFEPDMFSTEDYKNVKAFMDVAKRKFKEISTILKDAHKGIKAMNKEIIAARKEEQRLAKEAEKAAKEAAKRK